MRPTHVRVHNELAPAAMEDPCPQLMPQSAWAPAPHMLHNLAPMAGHMASQSLQCPPFLPPALRPQRAWCWTLQEPVALASPLGVHTRALQMGPVARHICSYSHARVDRSITSPWFLVTPAPGQGQESGSILPRELPLPHHLVPARHRTLEVRAKGATREGEGFGNNFQPPAPTMPAWAHNRLGACPGALDTTGAMRERAAPRHPMT